MTLVVAVWIVAIVAGLCWARWVVLVTTALTVLLAMTLDVGLLGRLTGWFQIVALGLMPWLLAAQRAYYERSVKRLQSMEAVRISQLQDTARALLSLQSEIQQLEGRIGQLAELYHVTKETTRALHVSELFAILLSIVPRLIRIQGVRMIDLAGPDQAAGVYRSRRESDGRLMPEHATTLVPLEHAVLARVLQTQRAEAGDATNLEHALPAGLERLAWAPLWGERQPIGVVIADGLPPEQLGVLTIVANQLALQLARVRLYQTVEASAITDALTGLFVRRYFAELAAEELQRSRRHRLPCTFLMVDLDIFKAKNDTYGHLVGDVVLRDVAQLLAGNLREIDLMARYGGEEFILLLVETNAEQAAPIAERLRQLIEIHSIRAYDELLHQTVSIGIACFPDDGQTLGELIERADQALYAAKRAGRNRVVCWSKDLTPV